MKLAVVLSHFLSSAGAISVNALDIRVDLEDIHWGETSAVDDLDDF